MAYLSSDARAASKGLYGRGGNGITSTTWHDMPDAMVRLLSADDIRGDLEIRWYVDIFEGVLADLTIDEARTLRDRLVAVITEFEGPVSAVSDNDVDDTDTVNADGTVQTLESEPAFCRECNGRISLLSNGTDYWWTHEPHSINDHEPVPEGPAHCRVCGGRIMLVATDNYRGWEHYFEPWTEHDAVPGLVTLSHTSGEAA
ncbi:hypothetical protein D7D52_34110 [Nocardia yunnanensis]|uniref:Uncharacterized protein n=1 Tax=Nocardia yunnanensis TaxID=2382165 RepID=A0A386ZJH4_9NOCA|nr:hypothetical protein [Nocardia yunnanensis]AYF78022.1 hypothetical protein D7D52_34110 [Nocardia yunnanensis]